MDAIELLQASPVWGAHVVQRNSDAAVLVGRAILAHARFWTRGGASRSVATGVDSSEESDSGEDNRQDRLSGLQIPKPADLRVSLRLRNVPWRAANLASVADLTKLDCMQRFANDGGLVTVSGVVTSAAPPTAMVAFAVYTCTSCHAETKVAKRVSGLLPCVAYIVLPS